MRGENEDRARGFAPGAVSPRRGGGIAGLRPGPESLHSEYLMYLYSRFELFVGTPPTSTDRTPDKRTGKIYNSPPGGPLSPPHPTGGGHTHHSTHQRCVAAYIIDICGDVCGGSHIPPGWATTAPYGDGAAERRGPGGVSLKLSLSLVSMYC